MRNFQIFALGIFCLVGGYITQSVGQGINGDHDTWLNCSEGSDLIPPPECPGVDPETPIYFRFPSDCSQFYECANGVAYCFKCPDGTLWDQSRLTCNYPSEVDCSDVPTPVPSTSTTQRPTPTTTDPIDWICPEGYEGLLPHPTDCKKFYLCDPDRRPCLFECPGNLCFNPISGLCDGPESGLEVPILNTGFSGQSPNYRNVNRHNFAQIVLFLANKINVHNIGFSDPCEFIRKNVQSTKVHIAL